MALDQRKISQRKLLARLLLGLLLLGATVHGHAMLSAEETKLPAGPSSRAHGLQEYRSQFLVVYTTLPPEEARPAIKRLERTLAHASKYWGRDPRGQIECYLFHDMEHLADADLPHRLSRVLVGGVGGATIPNRTQSKSGGRNKPIVVASSCPGIAEHELIHAYCTQTFGFTGPNWYSEGMAEMVVLQCTRESGVTCTAEQLKELRASHEVSLTDVRAGGGSSKLFDSLNAMLSHPKNRDRQVPMSDWKQEDSDNVEAARKDYLRSWALCYLLLHNPNYSDRFRWLGRKQITSNEDEFHNTFGTMEKELAFEYSFFLRNIGTGFRVDLCSWEWNRKFRPLASGESLGATLDGKKGFQASGLSIIAGQKYGIDVVASWSTSILPVGQTSNVSGAAGRIVGVVMKDFKLSEPFILEMNADFVAPATGDLYLRCHDALNELHDNSGQAAVRIQSL